MNTALTRFARPSLVLLTLLLAACFERAPGCDFEAESGRAPAAGCFAMQDGGVLIVEQTDGKFSLPGGAAEPGESARCAAQRETREETGLHLQVGELLQIFDNGFHLYRCHQPPGTGQPDPPRPLEIRRALYLQAKDFDGLNWRFPAQVELMRKLAGSNSAD